MDLSSSSRSSKRKREAFRLDQSFKLNPNLTFFYFFDVWKSFKIVLRFNLSIDSVNIAIHDSGSLPEYH